MADILATMVPGALIIIDGTAWELQSISGTTGRATNDAGKAIYFDAREITYLGAGLHGLPGRIEPKAVNPNATVVAQTATASGQQP